MPRTPRRRREVHPAVVKLASPLFRWSESRNAYILRGVGKRFGPVLRPPLEPLNRP
jgi:hypothetical protein